MTIALGMTTANGIVLAADTEESIAGYMKRNQTKIVVGVHSDPTHAQIAVSGAGDADYLDAINADMVDLVLGSKKAVVTQMKSELQARLTAFYREHVIPFAHFQSEVDRPEVALILAVSAPNQYVLWTTRRNLLKRTYGYGAVGVGAFYAQTLLSRIYDRFDIEVAAPLAVYVMSYVKEHVPDCGKETQIVCITKTGEVLRPYFRDVRDLEDAFKVYATVETTTLHYVTGRQEETAVKDITKAMREGRKEIMRLGAQMLKQAR